MSTALGLTSAQQKRYVDLLTSHNVVNTVVQLTTLNESRLADVSNQFLDGQITIDTTADVSRAVTLDMFDPARALMIDSNNPADGSIFLDRMMAIYVKLSPPSLSETFTVPVFRGPITKAKRDVDVIKVECQGKESFALSPVWTARTFRKGTRKVDIIRQLLVDVGETKFSFRSSSSRITKDMAVSSSSKPWDVCKTLARSLGMDLFYDARGVCVLRYRSTSTVWNYRDSGDDWSVLSRPDIGYDLGDFRNAIRVIGATPKGKKKPIVRHAYLPKSHPFSPWSLSRNGRPRYIWEEVSDDSVTSYTEASELANRLLSQRSTGYLSMSFDALPVYHLEEYDRYMFRGQDFSAPGTVQKLTIPLSVSDSSSVGYLRSQRPNKASIRRRR